jgi:hypothetical protein
MTDFHYAVLALVILLLGIAVLIFVGYAHWEPLP